MAEQLHLWLERLLWYLKIVDGLNNGLRKTFIAIKWKWAVKFVKKMKYAQNVIIAQIVNLIILVNNFGEELFMNVGKEIDVMKQLQEAEELLIKILETAGLSDEYLTEVKENGSVNAVNWVFALFGNFEKEFATYIKLVGLDQHSPSNTIH